MSRLATAFLQKYHEISPGLPIPSVVSPISGRFIDLVGQEYHDLFNVSGEEIMEIKLIAEMTNDEKLLQLCLLKIAFTIKNNNIERVGDIFEKDPSPQAQLAARKENPWLFEDREDKEEEEEGDKKCSPSLTPSASFVPEPIPS